MSDVRAVESDPTPLFRLPPVTHPSPLSPLSIMPQAEKQDLPPLISYRSVPVAVREVHVGNVSEGGRGCWPVGEDRPGWEVDLGERTAHESQLTA
jgi:hypothetical protein